MEEKVDLPENQPETKPAAKAGKKPLGKTIMIIVLVLLLAGVSGGASYWWRDKSAKAFQKTQADKIAALEKDLTSVNKQLTEEKAKVVATPAEPACVAKLPGTTTIENVEASITSGNTAALEGYMAASVTVATAAGAVTAGTPTKAVTSISSFITSDTTAWDYDFSLPAGTLSTYSKSGFGKYFPTSSSVVGKAPNKQVISFSFDCNAKISAVFLATNENLIK